MLYTDAALQEQSHNLVRLVSLFELGAREPERILIAGTVRQTAVFAENLALRREISTEVGSSILTIMVALGLVMNVSVRRFAY